MALSSRQPSLPAAGHYSEEKPFWAKLKETRLLTSQECQKRVLHVAFDVSGAGMRFAAGDSFTVHPANDRELVRGLLEHLGADGSQCATLPALPPLVAFCTRRRQESARAE